MRQIDIQTDILFVKNKENKDIEIIIQEAIHKKLLTKKTLQPRILARERNGLYLYVMNGGLWIKAEMSVEKDDKTLSCHRPEIKPITSFSEKLIKQINGSKHIPAMLEEGKKQEVKKNQQQVRTKEPHFHEVIKSLEKFHVSQHQIAIIYVDQQPSAETIKNLVDNHTLAYVRFENNLYYYNPKNFIKDQKGIVKCEALYKITAPADMLKQDFDQSIMGYLPDEKPKQKAMLSFEQMRQIHEKYPCSDLDKEDKFLKFSKEELFNLAQKIDVYTAQVVKNYIDRNNLYDRYILIREDVLISSPQELGGSPLVKIDITPMRGENSDAVEENKKIKKILTNIYAFLMLSRAGFIESNIFVHTFGKIIADSKGDMMAFITQKFEDDHFQPVDSNKEAKSKSRETAARRKAVPKSTLINAKSDYQILLQAEVKNKRKIQGNSQLSLYDLAADNAKVMAIERGCMVDSILFRTEDQYHLFYKDKDKEEVQHAYFWYGIYGSQSKSKIHHFHTSTKVLDAVPEEYEPIKDQDGIPMAGCFLKMVEIANEQINIYANRLSWST